MHRILKYTLLAGLLAVAAHARADGAALFWTIEGPAGHAGYLLGTVHSEDPRVLEYRPAFLEALGGSSVFAMELVPDVAMIAQLMEAMHLPEGERLAAHIGAARFERVAAALANYGMSPEQVARLKPWAAMMTLSVPPARSGLFMDLSLSLRASGSGLRVIGLETLDEQLAFLENLDASRQAMLLDHALHEFDQVEAVHRYMVDIYLEEDLDALDRMAREQMESLDPELRDYFFSEGIDARNRRMLENILSALQEEGLLFVAVGALHLPGEQGLVALLRKKGYRLTPLEAPFAGDAQAVSSGG